MENKVSISGIVAYRGAGMVILSCEDVYIQCENITNAPLYSFVRIDGTLKNKERADVVHTIVKVNNIEIQT